MKAPSQISLILIPFLLCSVVMRTVGEENLLLTKSEKEAFDQFKSRLLHKLPRDYPMRHDIFLIRWLRARNFNVEQAEDMILQDISWRKEYKMDSILAEDWSDMADLLLVEELTFDKSGSPVRQLDVESWNVRRVVLAGKGRRLVRYFVMKMFEEPLQQVVHHHQQQQLGIGNVTQSSLLVNLDGFNMIQHGCPLCLPIYAQFLLALENHYPGSMKNLVIINMPPSFRIVMDVIRPIFSDSSRQVLKVFGRNKKEWADFLLKGISPDQLGVRFGGTRAAKQNH